MLALWGREKLAADMGIADDGARWSGVTLAHNVGSTVEVESVIDRARAAGAEIVREPSPTFYGGYAGGFRDLDGHAWEVAFNPVSGSATTAAWSCHGPERACHGPERG